MAAFGAVLSIHAITASKVDFARPRPLADIPLHLAVVVAR